MFAGGTGRLLAGVEPAGHRRLEGDVDLLAVHLLDGAAALNLIELVADPHVGGVLVGCALEPRRSLPSLVQRAGERSAPCFATDE